VAVAAVGNLSLKDATAKLQVHSVVPFTGFTQVLLPVRATLHPKLQSQGVPETAFVGPAGQNPNRCPRRKFQPQHKAFSHRGYTTTSSINFPDHPATSGLVELFSHIDMVLVAFCLQELICSAQSMSWKKTFTRFWFMLNFNSRGVIHQGKCRLLLLKVGQGDLVKSIGRSGFQRGRRY